MSNLAGSDSAVLRWAGKLGTFLGLSLLWLLCCLPLVTMFPASVALYDCVVHCVHGDEDGVFRRFFVTLRDEVFRGILINLLWLGVLTVFIAGFGIVNTLGEGNSVFAVYSAIYAGTLVIPLSMLAWMIPLQARFQFGFFELHRKAMSFAIVHLPTTAAMIGILLLGVLVSIVILPMLVLIPAILVTMQAALTEKVLKRFEEEEFPIVK